jgi:DNA-binding XRE family transcriptional regulator
MNVIGLQIKVARALACISQKGLVHATQKSIATIVRAGSWDEQPKAHDETVLAVINGLNCFGVTPLGHGIPSTGAAGVRLLVDEHDSGPPSAKPQWGQIRAARVLAGWRQIDLANSAGVGDMTVRRAERAETWPLIQPPLVQLISITLYQRARVVCFPDGVVVNGGIGACFLPGQTPKADMSSRERFTSKAS